MGTVAIFGAGVMGETLLSGLVRAGRSVDDLVITERRPERVAELRESTACGSWTTPRRPRRPTRSSSSSSRRTWPGCSRRSATTSGRATSSSASRPASRPDFLESRLPPQSAVVRVMPNTPALVDQGMAALSPGRHCDDAHLEEASELLRSCGKVVQIAEKHQDAVTAISGSGPAYIFYVVEAMIEAGVVLGLPRATATELVVQTLYGAATMIKETRQHPTVLREQVTSPGGTTAAALRQLDDHKVRAAFITAMEAAAERSHQLASGNG